MIIRSIRWRLQLWLGALLIAVLSGFGTVVYQLQGLSLLNQLDTELEESVGTLNLALRGGGGPGGGGDGRRPPMEPGRRDPPPDFREPQPDFRPGSDRGRPGGPPHDGPPEFRPSRPEARIPATTFEKLAPGLHAATWSRDAQLLRRSTDGPESIPRPPRPGRSTRTQFRSRDGFRECYQFTEMGDCALVGRSLATVARAQRRFAWTLAAVGLGVLGAGLGGVWILTSRALRPVEEIREAASRIAGGNLSERIVTTEPHSEIGRLAAVLNATFDRLEAAFLRQRQFTADAAHELRTPISVLLVEIQSALSRERSAADYREALSGNLATARQMRQLTESLLQLARLDSGVPIAPPSPCDLARIADDAARSIRPLAESRQLELVLELDSTPVSGHAEQLLQVVTNLLANAIQYNRPGGSIRLRCRPHKHHALLEVIDTGIGIDPADLPHVFDRFFRSDRARNRAAGHTGLGLAICHAIVSAHQGRIGVTSTPGTGSHFTVTLPASGPAPAPETPP